MHPTPKQLQRNYISYLSYNPFLQLLCYSTFISITSNIIYFPIIIFCGKCSINIIDNTVPLLIF